jgi:hypothetical protein
VGSLHTPRDHPRNQNTRKRASLVFSEWEEISLKTKSYRARVVIGTGTGSFAAPEGSAWQLAYLAALQDPHHTSG